MADLIVSPRNFTSRHLERMLVIALRGRLTGELGAEVLEWLSTIERATPPHVVVNVGEITAVEPAGADALLDAYVATALRAGTLVVTHATAQTQRSLHRSGVIPVIETFADDAVAVATLRSRAQLERRPPSSSLADVVMLAHPADLNSFEFIRIAALRTAQLIQGCVPLVPKSVKPATTAMREVAAGKVRARPGNPDAGFRQLWTKGTP